MFKHLGLYEMILETIFKHWILVLGTPERCPALEQFLFFFLLLLWTLYSTSYFILSAGVGGGNILWSTVGTPQDPGIWHSPDVGTVGPPSGAWWWKLVFLCLGSPVFCTRQPALVKVSDWFFVVFYCILAEVVETQRRGASRGWWKNRSPRPWTPLSSWQLGRKVWFQTTGLNSNSWKVWNHTRSLNSHSWFEIKLSNSNSQKVWNQTKSVNSHSWFEITLSKKVWNHTTGLNSNY